MMSHRHASQIMYLILRLIQYLKYFILSHLGSMIKDDLGLSKMISTSANFILSKVKDFLGKV